MRQFNPLSVNFTKWSNTLKQFVGNLPTNCLSVFDHFVGLVLKGLRSKYHLKQITKTKEKNAATNENCILEKMDLKFQNASFNILCKATFWNEQKWLNKELIMCSGLPN